jgi:epidermal growth factor receptor substrate 15
MMSAYFIILFTGWQPGIQETAAAWDEEWDRFGDEGMLAWMLILPPSPFLVVFYIFFKKIKLCYTTCMSPGFSILKELTVEVESPAVQKSQPPVEDVKVSTSGALTEKEDGNSDKAAAAEQPGNPESAPSDSKSKSTKSPPVSPVKNKEDGYTDEPDKKQSVTNGISPCATETIRYAICFHFVC